MPRANSEAANRKAKKSFTLSAEAVAFLDAMRKERRVRSTSAILEDILRRARIEQGKLAVEKTISDYYSSLKTEEAKEHARWGDFAECELSNSTSVRLRRAHARS
jgi:hypothetical protein